MNEDVLVSSSSDSEPLRNGVDHPVDNVDNGWLAPVGSSVKYKFDTPAHITELRFVFEVR